MAEIILVRHGQASFGAENYDQLSDLGRRQAGWLGEHWATLGKPVDNLVMGTMVRHRQTAEGVLSALGVSQQLETHSGLNEYDFQGLLDALKAGFSGEWIETDNARLDYYHNLRNALGRWMNGSIATDGHDTWQAFCKRVLDAFGFASALSGKRVVVVSSAGPISVILAEILGLDHARNVDLTLRVKNSSTSSILYNRVGYTVDSVNDVSHLLTADKQQHITFS